MCISGFVRSFFKILSLFLSGFLSYLDKHNNTTIQLLFPRIKIAFLDNNRDGFNYSGSLPNMHDGTRKNYVM